MPLCRSSSLSGFNPLPPTLQTFSCESTSNFLSRVRKDRLSLDLIGVQATNPRVPFSFSRDQLGVSAMSRAKTNNFTVHYDF